MSVKLRTYVIAFQVKRGKVKGNSVAGWCNNLPDAVLIGWVEVGKGRTSDGAILRLGEPPTSVFTLLSVRMQFVANVALALVPAQCVDTFVFTAVVVVKALVEFFYKSCREASLIYGAVRDKLHIQVTAI